eukprot:g16309.t1
MPKFCGECGAKQAGSKFCGDCGAKQPDPDSGVVNKPNETTGLNAAVASSRETGERLTQGGAPQSFLDSGGHEHGKLFFRIKNIPATKELPCEFSVDGKVVYTSTEEGPIEALFYTTLDKMNQSKAIFNMNLKAVGVKMDKEIILKKGDHITLEVPEETCSSLPPLIGTSMYVGIFLCAIMHDVPQNLTSNWNSSEYFKIDSESVTSLPEEIEACNESTTQVTPVSGGNRTRPRGNGHYALRPLTTVSQRTETYIDESSSTDTGNKTVPLWVRRPMF